MKININILKFILLFMLTTLPLFSDDLALDDLLDEYRDSQELHLKTQKESAGFITVYSRKDLDRMQAYTLNDILKTMRIFTLQTNNIGMSSLVVAGGRQALNNNIKIFIDSYELNSATLGNAVTQYGKMGLYFIDHIEIYQAVDSVAFGDEPSKFTIKLYTKKPSRENATSTQASLDTRGSSTLRVLDARVFDDYSYLANIDISKNNFEKYNAANYELSKDGVRGQIYLKLSKKNDYDISVGLINESYDPFSGWGKAPIGGNITIKNNNIQFVKYLKEKYKLIFSASQENFKINNKDANGIMLYDNTQSNHLEANVYTNIYNIAVEKDFIQECNELSLRAQYKQKTIDIKDFESNSIDKTLLPGPKKLNIYMLSLRDVYNIDNNNAISFSAKIDLYEDDYLQKTTQNTLRLGYISKINQNYSYKIFAQKSHSYPTFMQTTFSPTIKSNPDLKPTQNASVAAELNYKKKKLFLSFGIGEGETKDSVIYTFAQKKYINSPIGGKFTRIYARGTYKFDFNNKIIVNYFKMYKKQYYSPGDGALLQIFNKIGKFDIYNELIYRAPYQSFDKVDMAAGYDYSFGIIYPINNRLLLKLKGENLLDKASQVPINGNDVPAIERRGLITMEYTF